VGARCGRL
ncbi:major Facilitator Superfamily protein, partial [Vibrio parahaemolyticus V-223/04]